MEYLLVNNRQLSNLLTRIRGHTVREMKDRIFDLYGLPRYRNPAFQSETQFEAALDERVRYLLQDDRYICEEKGYEASMLIYVRVFH